MEPGSAEEEPSEPSEPEDPEEDGEEEGGEGQCGVYDRVDDTPDVQPPVGWVDYIFKREEGDMRAWRPPFTAEARPRRLGPRNFGTKDAQPTPGSVFRRFMPSDVLDKIATASTAYGSARLQKRPSRG